MRLEILFDREAKIPLYIPVLHCVSQKAAAPPYRFLEQKLTKNARVLCQFYGRFGKTIAGFQSD